MRLPLFSSSELPADLLEPKMTLVAGAALVGSVAVRKVVSDLPESPVLAPLQPVGVDPLLYD